MAYTVCPNCGQNALRVATRCPRCGLAFESQFFSQSAPRPRRRRLSLGMLLAGAVVAVLGANALWQRFGVPPAPAVPAMKPATLPPARPQPEPQRESVTSVTESLVTPPPEAPRVPAPAESRAPVAETPVPPAAPVSLAGTRARYASTWLNVRSDRRNSASILRVLRPGEAVRVDSLSQGWYRVVADGEPAGWVDRRLLDSLPPSPQPTAHE